MSKKMLINALHPEEARIAIVEDGHLVELDIEVAGKEQTRGNIYKGVVVRVEPGLQAAFVDIGLKRLGFLQMGEIHSSQWQWREEPPADQKNRRPRIQEILRRGQEVLVQVEKGERDMKGAALTTYISLPGRYMVLMPGDDSTGISRKVENEAERKKLKEIVSELEIPEGIGYIVRTEAVGKKKTELAKDLDYLLTTYNGALEKAKATPAPAMIYQESSLVVRTIRDYFTAEIDEVLVDSKDVYKEARAFFKQTMPKYEKLVKQHQEKRPIFSKYQIEEQIDLIYEKKVPLKSGGSIIIEPTEAMVPIDVNSGKSTGEKGVEDTAFKTNMEAAAEVARQLRLRDLGGLIVIDFIDMRDRKHISEVEKALKTALKADKARVTVGKISQFGLMEMSRQRIKQTINEGIYLECPHCTGRGKLKSVEAMALSFLRKVHAAASKGTVAEVHGGLPLEVAYYLLNRKKRELSQIEDEYDIEVTVKGKTSFLLNQVELELVKRERPLDFGFEEAEKQEQPAAPAVTAAVEAEEKAEQPEGGKKKRRRKKGPGEAAEPLAAVAATSLEEGAEPEEEQEALEEVSTAAAAEGAEGATGRKKRRRRRKKKPAAALEAAVAEASQELPGEEVTLRVVESQEGEVEEAAAEGEEQPTEEPRKKRRRRRRRGKKPAEEVRLAEGEELTAEPAQPEIVEAAPEAEVPPAEETPEPKPKRTRRKGRAAAEQPIEAPVPEAAEAAAEPAAPETPAAEAPAEAKPARKRMSRVVKPTGTPEEVEAALREATRREYPKAAPVVSPEAPAAAEAPQPEAAEPAPAAPEAEAVIAVEEAKPKAKPRSRARKKPEAAAVEAPQPAEEPVPEPAAPQEAPAAQEEPKRTRARAKKTPEPAPAEAAEPAAPTPEAPAAEEKPKRKRAPRKKKEPEQAGE